MSGLGLIEHVLADVEQRSSGGIEGWYAFPQAHSDTTLGLGGVGGQMITSAPTIIVLVDAGDAYVYFGGRFVYAADWREAMEWVGVHRAPGRRERNAAAGHRRGER